MNRATPTPCFWAHQIQSNQMKKGLQIIIHPPQCRIYWNSLSTHQKKFRQINYLVSYLVKPLLSRNFCQKCVRENSRNFHTVSLKQKTFIWDWTLRIFLTPKFFTWNQFWRGDNLKNCHFHHLLQLWILIFADFCIVWRQKSLQIQNSEPPKLSKTQFSLLKHGKNDIFDHFCGIKIV